MDEPRKAVEEADTLVAEVMKRLAEVFANERRQLESQWEHADRISTSAAAPIEPPLRLPSFRRARRLLRSSSG